MLCIEAFQAKLVQVADLLLLKADLKMIDFTCGIPVHQKLNETKQNNARMPFLSQ